MYSNTIIKLAKSFLGILFLVTTVACNKNENSNESRARGNNPANIAQQVPADGYYTKATGVVTNSYGMTDQARNFLETNQLSADQIGNVDGNNGVTFWGMARFDSSNRFRSSDSYIVVKVVDDLAQSGQASPMTVSINNNLGSGYVSYQNSGNGMAYAEIVFKDDLGSITLTGYFDQNNFSGDMNYENYVTRREGRLGQFRISTCGFFVCGK